MASIPTQLGAHMTFELDLALLGERQLIARASSGGALDNNVSLVSSVGTNGSSSGSSVGAYPLTKDITFINAVTSAIAGNAAILPSNKGSGYITVFNNTAFTAYVFAPLNGQINNYAANGMQVNLGNSFAGSFQIGANKSACFMSPDGTTWLAQHAG